MNKREAILFWTSALWSLVATVLNLMVVLGIPQDRISFPIGFGCFLFCICGHISFILAGLWVASTHQLKKWPMWLNFIHPIFAFAGFLLVNWDKLRESNRVPVE